MKIVRKYIRELVFYGILVAVVLGAFFVGRSATTPPTVFGFSGMTVLTWSMEPDIPQDAMILTRRADPAQIQVGDDITYMTPSGMVIVHRVIEIVDGGFRTQGTNNPVPDPEIVAYEQVLGRVVYHNLAIGRVIGFAQRNVLFVALGIVLFTVVRVMFGKEDKAVCDRSLTYSKSR